MNSRKYVPLIILMRDKFKLIESIRNKKKYSKAMSFAGEIYPVHARKIAATILSQDSIFFS